MTGQVRYTNVSVGSLDIVTLMQLKYSDGGSTDAPSFDMMLSNPIAFIKPLSHKLVAELPP